MSIQQLNGPDRLRATTALAALRANAASAQAGAPSAATRAPDKVSISDAARSLAAAHKAVGDSSDVREDRVGTIKAAIADGTYAIDSHALAKQMLRSLAQ
jgi:negative regulator of flagellin synthesis FlgM